MTRDLGFPDYLDVPQDAIGAGSPVAFRVVGQSMAGIAADMAQAMANVVQQECRAGRAPTLIVPVGPVDQFPILADMINDGGWDWSGVVLINMDEYLTDDDRWVDREHPLSFRGYMDRKFYDLVDSKLAPRPENRVFPDPQGPDAIETLIERRGGVDACFGGIGINGHIAFNEPPEPGEAATVEEFAARITRVLTLSRETRTINSVTVGGELSLIPHRAVTVGMKEILSSRRLHLYCNRPWQRAVIRRVLHGPITASCPASLCRLHPDAQITAAEYVAERPEIGLR